MEKKSDETRRAMEEKDCTIHHLTSKLAEMESQQTIFSDKEQAMQRLKDDMDSRVEAAVGAALAEAHSRADSQRAELVDAYEGKLVKEQAAAEKRAEEMEFNFNVRVVCLFA